MDKKVPIYANESIYYLEKGSGDKTVIFMSGSGVSSVYTDMYSLWNKVSESSKVFMYDRFGMGKSSLTKKSRDIDTMVEEFNIVLEQTHQEPPYIIVAHSMSSLQAIRFAQKYPEQVEGLILNDGASPSFCEEFEDPMSSRVYQLKGIRKLGLLRLLLHSDKVKEQFKSKQEIPKDIEELQTGLVLKNLWNKTMINEREYLQKNGKVVSDGGSIEAIKLTVISAGENGFEDWDTYQEQLMNISDTSKRIIVDNSGHFIHHEYPEIIINAIIEMINDK